MIHLVKLRKNKANRKDEKNWPLDLTYPVVSIDMERMKAPEFSEEEFKHPLADGYSKSNEAFDIELDEDDQEEMEALLARARKKATKHTPVRTWFLIAHPKKGSYKWVTTEEIRFSSVS